jgi:hypothetical protein
MKAMKNIYMKQALILLALALSATPAWAETYTGKVICQGADGTVVESYPNGNSLHQQLGESMKPLLTVTTPPFGPNRFHLLSASIDTAKNQIRLAGAGVQDFDGEWFVLYINTATATGRLERQLFQPMDLTGCSW